MIAYAVKYLKMSLKDAFTHLQEVRNYGRPNLAFFEQLVQFEYDVLEANSVEMVAESMEIEDAKKSNSEKKKKKNDGPQQLITVPNFYKKEYPHLFKLEVAEARAGNCPMVSTSSTKTSTTSCSKTTASSAAKKSKSSTTGTMEQTYVSNELKPFLVEQISYQAFLAELNKARLLKQSKPRAVTPGKSLKTKH